MSSFSYISFPRVPDTHMLKSSFDPSKSFTVKEIRGTELEKRFQSDLSVFPKEADNLNIYFGDFFNDFNGISIAEEEDVTFTGIFENTFIYGLSAQLKKIKNESELRSLDDTETTGDSFIDQMIKSIKSNYTICRNQLKELVEINLLPCEKVEIYTEYVSGLLSDLGPYEKEISITSDQILTTECFNLDRDKLKIVIHKIP